MKWDYSRKKKQNVAFNLDKVLKMEDETNIIIAIDDYLNSKSNYCEDIEKLNMSQQTFIIIENLEREMNNGGFSQFYFNSSGNFSHATVDALVLIGANQTADIVKKANAQFPNNKIPSNKVQRQYILEEIEEKAEKIWEICDDDFLKYEDNLTEQLLHFVRANKTEFEQ